VKYLSRQLRGREIENRTLKAFVDYATNEFPKEQGWVSQSIGFPDAVLFNIKTREIVFVELKANNHEFHKFQKQMLYFLTHSKNPRAIVVNFQVDLVTGETKMSNGYPRNFETEPAKGWMGGRTEVEDAGVLKEDE
jgi:hypothetical protein